MKTTCFFIIALCVNLLQFNVLIAQEWTLAKQKNEVSVYTRFIEGWSIKEYKAVFKVRSELEQVIKVLKDIKGRINWLYNTIEVKPVGEQGKDKICFYSQYHAPWPVSNRDNITIFHFRNVNKKIIRIEMECIPSLPNVPEKDGLVRIKELKGHWIIKDLGNGMIEVIQQCVADPGGSLPDWLANSSVVDSPYNSMLSLKKIIEKAN